jgi:hypothetical protein
VPAIDWWAPLGAAGEQRVAELVADERLVHRALGTANVREIVLAETDLLGARVTGEVGHRAYRLREGERTVVRLELPSEPARPWTGELAGSRLELTHEQVDLDRSAGAKPEQVLFLRIRTDERVWVAHHTGGRLAGERFVLSHGDLPHASPPVVTCLPAERSRQLPRSRLRRRQPADQHVTSWTAAASGADIALAELLLLARLHNAVDYLGAAVAGTAREIAGIWRVFTPVPEPLPTKPGD